MARYTHRIDVHTLTREERAALQPGQHISASGALGRWVGQTPGADVAAWRGTAKNHSLGAVGYFRALADYRDRCNGLRTMRRAET